MTHAEHTSPVIDLARDLADQIATRADSADKQGRLPPEDVQALKESGYFAISVPAAYGGLELSLRACVEAQLELAQGSASTAMVAAMPIHMIGAARENRQWADEHFEQLCRILLDGGLINSCASEPALGSPSRGGTFHTHAVKTSGGYCINGHKNWSTGGAHLTHLLVSLTLDGETAQFLVPNHLPGIRWEPTWQHALSLRASDSDDVYFENVIVPEENLLRRGAQKPGPNAWFPLLTAAVYFGAAIAARNAAVRFALERVPTALGKPIATLPKIQRQIGEIDTPLQAARLMLLDAAGAWDNQEPDAWARVVAAKHFANEAAILATDIAMRVVGGQALTGALPLERHFRDVRGGITHPPSGDTALEIVGRAAIDALSNGASL
ncbi:MAG TPA: acyl-CoA dehydrogenase family protein [Spirillospora sp.]|nr:acyl-CoA dehydrogenase family protein [Spirillospora sp.]